MIGKDKSYIKSNEITEVKLKAFRSSFSKDIILCGESITSHLKIKLYDNNIIYRAIYSPFNNTSLLCNESII